ncbi:hypothetical protein F5X96DRAFT_662014, partial [Biscogniauxia mediterranea]
MSLPLPREGRARERGPDPRRGRWSRAAWPGASGLSSRRGLILKVLGPTLSSLWRDNEGSDDVPGTYAHWLRHGTMMYWCQDQLPDRLDFQVIEPYKRGPLLKGEID